MIAGSARIGSATQSCGGMPSSPRKAFMIPSGCRNISRQTTEAATHEITLERRSAYLMKGESRNAYEHHIPAVTTLRYSITFRTVRS